MRRKVAIEDKVASCYFRSMVKAPYRKALVQITERCNLFCAHCFLSAGDYGDAMTLGDIQELLIPQLKECSVVSVTLTGGEPFVHPEIVRIVQSMRESDIRVGICSNATVITAEHIESLVKISEVHVNVSLDGFSAESHGRFRGNKDSFSTTIETIRQLSQHKLLQGLLVTPNYHAEVEEYAQLCRFAVQNGAKYVLMNPLSSMGRGVKTRSKLGSPSSTMLKIKEATSPFREEVELAMIRFPNEDRLPLASCEAGNIIYVFTRGEMTVCPYLVFAANTPGSKHYPQEFIVGNIFKDADIAQKLSEYRLHERYRVGDNSTCHSCDLKSACGKGCPAAIISSGQKIGSVDKEVCPIFVDDQEGV